MGASMSRITILVAATLALTATLPAVRAQAQSIRTFVSVAGSDTNPCSITQPCRHFQAAIDATSSGGEVDALDAGAYGSFTVSQGITIDGQGWSFIAPPSGGNAITINAVSGNVTLRGLSLNGVGTSGSNGIVFNTGKSLTVENCVVRKMSGHGLEFLSSATTTQTLAVSNSYFTNNAANGILIETRSSGAITAAIDRSEFNNNANIGLFVWGANGTGALNVAVTDSVAANGNTFNGNTGFDVESGTNQSVSTLSLTHSLAVGNAIGVAAGQNSTLWLAQSTVTGNAVGYDATNGVIKSYGDNYLLAGNNSNLGSLTSASRQ
jgi:hypothetical protein